MGKLYDLVEFKNHLINQLDHLSLDKSIQDKIESLEKTKRVFPQYAEYCDQTIKNYLSMAQQNQATINSIHEQISVLDSEIDRISTSLFDNDEYQNTFHENKNEGSEFKNSLIVSEELENSITSKITEYSDWHYPALQISPRSKEWIDPMVAGDPLYLTHDNINIVKEMIKPYPDLYQTRLRLYRIIDRDFSVLPQAQFGFVLCWDNFNYLSLDKIEKYIKEVWKLLRPGGHFIFSYSNCDLPGVAFRAEKWACSYSNSRWLTKLLKEIGYEIIESHDVETGDAFNTHVSWVDIKKPGELKTVKAHQALAQIITK